MMALAASLVTWHTVTGNPASSRAGALLPGLRIALRLVLLDEDEVRHRFDGHQTDLWMKGFILAEGNLAGRHRGGKSLVFLLAETDQQRLHLLGHHLLGSIGRGDELVQTAQFQKPTQVAQTAIVGLDEHQMGGREQSMEEVESLGRFQEPRHAGSATNCSRSTPAPGGSSGATSSPAHPIGLQSDDGRVQGESKVLELGHLFRHPPAGPEMVGSCGQHRTVQSSVASMVWASFNGCS